MVGVAAAPFRRLGDGGESASDVRGIAKTGALRLGHQGGRLNSSRSDPNESEWSRPKWSTVGRSARLDGEPFSGYVGMWLVAGAIPLSRSKGASSRLSNARDAERVLTLSTSGEGHASAGEKLSRPSPSKETSRKGMKGRWEQTTSRLCTGELAKR